MTRISENAGAMADLYAGFAQLCAGVIAALLRVEPLDLGGTQIASVALAALIDAAPATALAGLYLLTTSRQMVRLGNYTSNLVIDGSILTGC